MIAIVKPDDIWEIQLEIPPDFFPTEDDEPVDETSEHFWVIATTFTILLQYLTDRDAYVSANQFLYYLKDNHCQRVAPDVMVVFGTPVKHPPQIVFEITSQSTANLDLEFKKNLYAAMGIAEYWLFDPYGEWIPQQLIGYLLDENKLYQPIANNCSEVLQLQLRSEGFLIGFYRLDNGERLPPPSELSTIVVEERERNQIERKRTRQAQLQVKAAQLQAQMERQRAQEAELQVQIEQRLTQAAQLQAQEEKARADRLEAKLRELGVDL